jgi:hypothetical protein
MRSAGVTIDAVHKEHLLWAMRKLHEVAVTTHQREWA